MRNTTSQKYREKKKILASRVRDGITDIETYRNVIIHSKKHMNEDAKLLKTNTIKTSIKMMMKNKQTKKNKNK